MALSLAAAVPAFSPAAAPVASAPRAISPVMETKADLVPLAEKLNPLVGFWDPLNLSGADLWGKGNEATIGWIRHAEIKHGRVAMFAFVGYCVTANGVHWPWALNAEGTTFADISAAGYPNEQWDALPTAAKLQILGAIGFLEFIGEGGFNSLEASGAKHYMKGGKPGYYPSIKKSSVPHPVPFDLFDPFGLSKNASPEKKANGLVAEINNGRLAMIGIMGFMCQAKGLVVPSLTGLIPTYAGEPMAPFAAGDSSLLFVTDMLGWFKGGSFPHTEF